MSYTPGIVVNKRGYTDDYSGYSGVFSWWRSSGNRGLWHICGHIEGLTEFMTRGVTDDFGTIVRVQ